MTFKPATLLLAMIAVLAVPAFAQNIAVVNGKGIPKARAEAIRAQVVAQGQTPDSPELMEMIKKDLIAREVMMQEAIKGGYDKKPEVTAALENARQTIVVTALMREHAAKNKISDAAVKAEYDKAKAQAGDKEYHVRHILTETEADAKAVIAKLKAGSKFEDLAKTSKDQGTASTGGDLDWATPAAFPKPFSDAFVGLAKGAVTQNPVQTQNGWHVIKLDDTRTAKLPGLDEVKQRIYDELQQRQLLSYQEALVKKATIK